MTISPSSTSTGKGEGGPRGGGSRPTSGVRQRYFILTSTLDNFFIFNFCFKRKPAAATGTRRVANNNAGSMWRFYQEDSPGLKV